MSGYKDVLNSHFNNVDQIMQDIYANGGTRVNGYGFISGGYGGGIDINQAHMVNWLDGYLKGLIRGDQIEGQNLMKAINQYLEKEMGVLSDLPFINLDKATLEDLEKTNV